MTITGQSGMSLLDSILSSESARVDAGVAVLKKAQDAEKTQGEAMVQMLEKSVPSAPGHLLDVYA